MPAWDIHDKWAGKLGISRRMSREINSEIDSIDDPRFHDYGRVIVNGKWDFKYLFPVLESFYMKWRREDAVKGFLLHHILDYMDTLLTSPSVYLDNAVKFVDKLIKALKSDADKNLKEEFRDIVINACNAIHELIRSNISEIITDIKPEYTEHFKWAEERLLKLFCTKCGKQFATIDSEARDFFASRGVGIPKSFLECCLKCRGRPLSLWLKDKIREPHTGFHRSNLPPSLQDEYWYEIIGKANALIYLLRFEELRELGLV